MKTVYVIVHKDCVRVSRKTHELATPVYEEIQRIEREEEFYRAHFLDKVPKKLPKPSSDLVVKVCGAFTRKSGDGCVDQFVETLQRAGYQPVTHEAGTLKSRFY